MDRSELKAKLRMLERGRTKAVPVGGLFGRLDGDAASELERNIFAAVGEAVRAADPRFPLLVRELLEVPLGGPVPERLQEEVADRLLGEQRRLEAYRQRLEETFREDDEEPGALAPKCPPVDRRCGLLFELLLQREFVERGANISELVREWLEPPAESEEGH